MISASSQTPVSKEDRRLFFSDVEIYLKGSDRRKISATYSYKLEVSEIQQALNGSKKEGGLLLIEYPNGVTGLSPDEISHFTVIWRSKLKPMENLGSSEDV